MPARPPQPDTPPKTREALFAYLDALGVNHKTIEHPAFFTVEDSADFKGDWPGGHSKNLFLKDKKGTLTLVVAWAQTRVDLVDLGKAIGSKGRLSFGKPELMTATLGVIPGAVTPFALINSDVHALASVILDEALMAKDPLWFHPLENTASTAVSPADLVRFIESCGFTPQIIDLTAPLGA